MFVDDDLEFVKGQIKHHQRQIDRFARDGKEDSLARHAGLVNRFKDLLEKMKAARGLPAQESRKALSDKVGHRLGDLGDLPEDIRRQLVSAQYDELETKIVEFIDGRFDGVASIDEIFVALWRETREITEREFLARKIYRMTTKNLLFPLSGKKGVYATSETDAEGGAGPTGEEDKAATDQ